MKKSTFHTYQKWGSECMREGERALEKKASATNRRILAQFFVRQFVLGLEFFLSIS